MEPTLLGRYSAHPRSRELAEGVYRLFQRYSNEVVLRFALCPFLREGDSGYGAFFVVLDPEPVVETLLSQAPKLRGQIAHFVLPLVKVGPRDFERFGNSVSEALQRGGSDLVLASFHPELAGGTENPHRVVGLFRRAPDPFVQFVPAGLATGGTVFATGPQPAAKSHGDATFHRLGKAGLAEVQSVTETLRSERRALDPLVASILASG